MSRPAWRSRIGWTEASPYAADGLRGFGYPKSIERVTRTFLAARAFERGTHRSSRQVAACGNHAKSAENGLQSMLARQLLKSRTTGDPGTRWYEPRVIREFRRAPIHLNPPSFSAQQGTYCRALRVVQRCLSAAFDLSAY